MSIESRAANRAGLARFRPLAARSKNNSNINPGSKTNGTVNQNSNNGSNNKNNITDLPDGWYFNETREQDFWNDIERGEVPKTDESEAKALMNKKNDQLTDLQDTSSKLRGLVDQFDEIDQDTLMILLQLYDDGYGVNEDLDQQMIMSDSKTHVLDFMTQLKGLSDSQTALMENLRFFFSTLQQHSTNGESENISGEEIPDIDDTFEQLSSYLREYAERSEHAACLHNDINDFWFKQISNYKRIVLMRDEEIRKLQKTINDAHDVAQARRSKKKGESDKSNENSKIDPLQKESLENQIRLNQELKDQIDQLKAALKEGEAQSANFNSAMTDSSIEILLHNKDNLLKSNDINTLKIEFETRISTHKAAIEQLLKQIEHLKKNLCDQEIKYEQLSHDYKEIEKERDELNQALQKQIKLLEIEQKRNENRPEIIQDDKIDRQELYEAEMRHQNEIREINERYRNEIMKASEEEREKFLLEKQKLIDAIESGDTKSIIEAISSECEDRILKQKEEYENKEKGIIQIWAGKVALLTRQYENRIKAMAASHEVDMMMAKDSLKYEIQKAELDIEEKYNLQLLEMGRERKEKYEQFNKEFDKISNDLVSSREENNLLKAQLKVLLKNDDNEENDQNAQNSKTTEQEATDPEKPNPSENQNTENETQAQNTENENNKEIQSPNQNINNNIQQNNISAKSSTLMLTEKEQLMEKYAMKMKIMKQEMDDQMQWALDKQKNYYEREISRVMIQHQTEMRERLMELQEVVAHSDLENLTSFRRDSKSKIKISKVNSESKVNKENKEGKENNQNNQNSENDEDKEDEKTSDGEEKVLSIMREISQAFFNMNSQFEKIDEIEEEPTMTVKEAAERTKVLTDRLIEISSENQELKSSQVFSESSDAIIQKLRERLSYMESIQSGDIKSAVEKMNQMEAQHKHELEVKDQMILNFQKLNEMYSKMGYKPKGGLQIEVVWKEITNMFENIINKKNQPVVQHQEESMVVSEIDFNAFFIKASNSDDFMKAIPPEVCSAPIEYTTLKKPYEKNYSNTARKKPMRMHHNTTTQSILHGVKIKLSIPDDFQSFEIYEIAPLKFKSTAFLIDEELHDMILDEIIPIHVENERNLVSKVVDEVFERLPLSKTNEIFASENEPELNSGIAQTTSNRSIVSQSVSPRQKSINSTEKHYSMVVINSFYIPSSIIRTKPKPKSKPKPKPTQNQNQTQNQNENQNETENSTRNNDDNNNVVVNNNNDDDDDEFITLEASKDSMNYFEIKEKKIVLQTFLNDLIESVNPQFDKLFDEKGHFLYARNREGGKTYQKSSYRNQSHKARPSSPKQQKQTTTNEQTKQNHQDQQEEAENGDNKENKESSEANESKIKNEEENQENEKEIENNNNDEEEEEFIMFEPSIDNEVLIDIPYILYTNDELQEEVKTHILELEKEISELKGRPLPTQVVNTYVPREVNPDQRQITLQLYMPLTGEESKKLREEKKRRCSKDTSPIRSKQNKENTENQGLQPKEKISFEMFESLKENNNSNNNNQIKKLDESSQRSKSLASIEHQKEEPELTITHAESQLALTKNLSSLNLETDPFAAAKQIIISNIKNTHKYTANEAELLKTMNQNMEAFDAYVTASGMADESSYSFFNNLKQSKKDLDTNFTLAFQINVANDSLAKRINQMTEAYEKLTKKLAEIETESESQNIALQKEILDSIAIDDGENGQPTPSSNLEKLHKLESSLDLLESLGLIVDPELIAQKQTLLDEIKSTENKISSNEEVLQEEIDKLIIKTQDFIAGIKPSKSRPSSPTIDENDDSQTKEQMKKDLSRIRHQRDSLKRSLKNEKQKNDELKQQIIALNNKIETERETYNSDLLLYKAEVDTLKKSLSSDGQTAIDLLKQQLVSMQALAESSRNERDLFKSKLDDAEDALIIKEETIDRLNQQIETLLQSDFEKSQEMEYNKMMMKKKSSKNFKLDDYDMSKEVNKLNDELKLEQQKQMETMMAENKKLTDECNKLNQKIIKLKQKLRSVKDANADMNLRFALGFNPQNERRSDKATQYPPASFLNQDDDDENDFKNNSTKMKGNSNSNKDSKIRNSGSQLLNNNQKLKEEREREVELNRQKEKEEEEAAKKEENELLNNINNQENENNENEEQKEEEEIKESNEEQNINNIQENCQNMCESYDTFDSYEELDTVGDVLLKMPDDKSDDNKYEFGDIAPRVHDPIYLPKKKKKTSIMILNNTKPKTQRSNGKRIQPPILHHLPGGPSIETKLKEREEEINKLTINNQPQGKRYLTGTNQPVRPTSSVLKSNGPRNNVPMFDQDGNQIDVGNEDQMPIVESSFKLPTFVDSDLSSSYTNSNGTLNSKLKPNTVQSKENNNIKNLAKTSYIIDKSLQSNPIAPLRITLVVHDKDKEKEQRKSLNNNTNVNNGPVIIPVQNNENPLKRMVTPLGNYSKGQPPIVGRPIEKPPAMTEAQKIINKLRESKRRLQASNDQKDIDIVNLKQKLSELTLAIHRLKLDNIKKADDYKRLSIRYDYSQNRLEVRSIEVANKDEEIQRLKRELVVLRMQVQPVNQQLAKLKNAQREKDRLKREQERRKQVALATKTALGSKSTNDSTKKHLQTILENQQISIARIEAQRRMWAEIERNHMMGVLSAMSLLSTSQYKIVRGVLPSYSPFQSSKVKTLKQVLEMKNRENSYRDKIDSAYLSSSISNNNKKEEGSKGTLSFSYADKMNAINRIEPPLSNEEKEMVILQKETPEIEQKIVSLLQAERSKNTMSKAKIETNAIGSNS